MAVQDALRKAHDAADLLQQDDERDAIGRHGAGLGGRDGCVDSYAQELRDGGAPVVRHGRVELRGRGGGEGGDVC